MSEQNVNLILKQEESTEEEVVVSFSAIIRKLKKYFAVWFLVAVIVGGLIAGVSVFFRTTSITPVHAIVSFTHKGIENGKNPDGTDFDANTLKSPEIIESALRACDRELDLLEPVRRGIEIEGIIPENAYQKTGALRSLSQSMTTILTPVLATMLFAFGGISTVILVDLITFSAAFFTLLFFIQIPEPQRDEKKRESLFASVKAGLSWLKAHPLILKLIFFLAGINLVASANQAAMSPLILSKTANNEAILGTVNFFVGAATCVGSFIASAAPPPKNRVKAICFSLFVSMSTENFILSCSESPVIWCIGVVSGWILIPFMGANLDVVFRSTIPADMQGRVYACRNTLQFFTIPIGGLWSGALIDHCFEPFMVQQGSGSLLCTVFGTGKGAGAALLMAVLGAAGLAVCVIFSLLLKHEAAS